MSDEKHLNLLKERFKEEMTPLSKEELVEYYARELAKRDNLIKELQEQNQLILKSSFKQKEDELQ